MNIQKLLKRANLIRVGGNAHRFICRINGKLRSFTTHEKDIDNNLASLFGNLNACTLTPKAALSLALAGMMGFSSLAVWAEPANPLPTGGTWQGGKTGSISISPDGKTMDIDSSHSRSAIQWNTFDIGTGYTVNFNLPSASSAILNRVTSGNASQIMGHLNSYGHVYLINPNGILVGQNASVNVASLLMSSIDITNKGFTDFMAGGLPSFDRLNPARWDPSKPYNFLFNPDISIKNPSAVVLEGKITVLPGGFVILAGSAVETKAGSSIDAPNGYVGLTVGEKVTMIPDSGVGVRMVVDKELQNKVAGYTEAIKNAGKITADGGLIQLQAMLKDNIYSRAVNNSGRIEANTLAVNDKGQVELLAYGGNTADIRNTGVIDVSGVDGAANGGTVKLVADDKVTLSGDLLAGPAAGGERGQVIVEGKNVETTGTVNTGGGHLNIKADQNITTNNINTQGGDVNLKAASEININNDLTARNITLDARKSDSTYGKVTIATGKTVHATGKGVTDFEFDDDPATAAPKFTGSISTAGANAQARDNAGKITIYGNTVNKGTLQADRGGVSNIVITYRSNDVKLNGISVEALTGATADGVVDVKGSFINNGTIKTTSGEGGGPGSITITTYNNHNIVGNNAILKAGKEITLDSAGDIGFIGSTKMIAGTDINMSAARDIKLAGSYSANNGDLVLKATRDVLNSSKLWATDNIVVEAGNNIVNDGSIDPVSVTLQSGQDIVNNSEIKGDYLLLHAGRDIRNTGEIGDDTTSAVTMLAGRNLRVTDSGNVFGQYIYQYAGRDISNAGQIGNAFTAKLYQWSARDINNSGLLMADKLQLVADRDVNNSSGFNGITSILAIANRNLNNNGWFLGSNVAGIARRNLNNRGIISGTNNVFLAANRDLNNFNAISASNQLLGFSGRDINNHGTMTGDVVNSLHAFRNLNNFSSGFIGGNTIYAQAENNVNVAGLIGDSNTVLASVNAGHDVNVTSTETGDCCDPNGPTANQAGRVFGDTIEVYAANDVNVDGYVGDGRADSTTNVTANNDIKGRGLFSGNTVNLRSLNGNIGSSAQHVRTAANRLALNAANGSVYADQLGSVSLLDSTAANIFALKVFKACAAPEGTKAHLNIDGNVSGATVYLETDNGNIISNGLTSGGHVHIAAHGGSIIDGNGDALNLLATGDSSLWADGTIGALQDPFDVNVGGKLFVGAEGSDRGISIVINGTTGDDTLNPLNVPPGAVIFNGQYLFGNGPVREVLQRGVPYMLQDYRNMTNPLFTTAANTSGKLLKPGALRNVQAEIINKWQQPEPFDLRLIQSDEQGEAYELLMNH
jgi:filamentous hemagglutinin family protein